MTGTGGRLAFLLGTGRCGSTLAHEVLCLHDDVGFISNLDDRLWPLGSRGRWNKQLFVVLEHLTPAQHWKVGNHRVRFAPSEGYRLLEHHVSPMLFNPSRDLLAEDATPWLRERLRRFFEARMETQRPAVLVQRFTGWPRAGLLHAVFPDAKFIHIVRDGRAVASSWLQTTWWAGYGLPAQWQFGGLSDAQLDEWRGHGSSFVELAGLTWANLIEAFETARQTIEPEQWLTVRYEDLITSPEPAIGKLVDFLELRAATRFTLRSGAHRFGQDRIKPFEDDLGSDATKMLTKLLEEPLRRYSYLPNDD